VWSGQAVLVDVCPVLTGSEQRRGGVLQEELALV